MKSHLIFNYTLHKELYRWILEDIVRKKKDWPRWKRNGGDIDNLPNNLNCFACAYAESSMYLNIGCIKDEDKCLYCPFDIDVKKSCLNNKYLNYSLLKESIRKTKKLKDKELYIKDLKKIIEEIIDFPVKKDIQCI